MEFKDESRKYGSPIYRRWQWRVLFGFCFFYLMQYSGRLNIGFALPLLQKEFGWTSSQLGWISGIGLWSYGISHMITGRLADKYGARLLVTLGGIGSWACNLFVTLARSIGAFTGLWGLNMFVQGFGWSPGTQLISQWYPKRERGKAMGIAVFAAGWSGIVVWLVAGYCARFGWKAVFTYSPLLLIPGSIVFFILAKSKPADAGLAPYEEEDAEIQEREALEPKKLEHFVLLLKNWRFDLGCIAIALGNISRYGLLLWIPLYYSKGLGIHINKIFWVSIGLPVGMAAGPLIAGWISDRYFKSARYQIIMIYSAIAAVVGYLIAFMPTDSLTLGIVLMFLAGFFVYGSHGPLWAFASDMGGRKMAGTALGLMDTVAYVGAGIQGVFIGWILTMSKGDFFWMFILIGSVQLLAGALIRIAKR